MQYKIETLEPKIFPKNKIISAVTLKNEQIKPYGLTISGEHFDSELIDNHRKILAEHLNVKYEHMIFQKQVHSNTIKIVNDNYKIGESDALITSIKQKFLNISIADCCAILIYDPTHEIIAAVHSGWQGTQKNIVTKVVRNLKTDYKSNPKDILVYLSPCASVEKYEVGKEFYGYFPDNVLIERGGKVYFDNLSMIVSQLLRESISVSNIEEANICTISDERFHSFRRDKEKSGRMSALIGMI